MHLPLKIVCSTFNDKDSLKRHLISVPQYVHHEVWDGRYKDFDYPSLLSDDGSREVANLFYNVKLVDAGGYTEVEKRQKYLDSFDPNSYKFLLVADSDEYFEGDWQTFLYDLEELYEKYYNSEGNPVCFTIDVFSTYHNKYDARPRIWINAHNVLMGPKHNAYRNKKNGEKILSIFHITSLKINHDYKLRYETYNILRKQYQKKLTLNEKYF